MCRTDSEFVGRLLAAGGAKSALKQETMVEQTGSVDVEALQAKVSLALGTGSRPRCHGALCADSTFVFYFGLSILRG